jgi:hypothetical protein
MRLIAFIIGLMFSQASMSADVTFLGAAYVDTVNSVNVKCGVVFNEPYEYDEEKPYYYGSFKYADVEVGLNGSKLTVGFGSQIGHGLDRVGLSYAKLNTQELAGVEAVISQMFMSIKLGYYLGLDNTNNRWLFGLGFGF